MLKPATIAQLEERMEYNLSLAQEAERQYEILTDQYMNGNILGPIGKQQAKLRRVYDKAMREAEKCRQKLAKG